MQTVQQISKRGKKIFLWVLALITTMSIIHTALLIGTRYLDHWIGDTNVSQYETLFKVNFIVVGVIELVWVALLFLFGWGVARQSGNSKDGRLLGLYSGIIYIIPAFFSPFLIKTYLFVTDICNNGTCLLMEILYLNPLIYSYYILLIISPLFGWLIGWWGGSLGAKRHNASQLSIS